MDLCNLSVSLNDQQKTLDQSLDRLKVAREDVEETVHVVKTEYKKLMACFESWWKVTASMSENFISTYKLGGSIEFSSYSI